MTSDGVQQAQPPVSTEWTVSRQALRKFIGLEPGEGVPAFLAGLMFFCLMGAYFILKPLRDEMGIAGGVRNLPNLYLVTLAVMLVAAPLFGAASRGRRREVFLPRVYRFLGANLLLFFALFSLLPGADAWLGRGFYVWVSVFNLFSLSLFWGFMADGFGFQHGRRVLGVVAVGGTAGAILGASITGLLVQPLGRVPCSWCLWASWRSRCSWYGRSRVGSTACRPTPAGPRGTRRRPARHLERGHAGVEVALPAGHLRLPAALQPQLDLPLPGAGQHRGGGRGGSGRPGSAAGRHRGLGADRHPARPSWPSPDASCVAWAPAPSWRPCRW